MKLILTNNCLSLTGSLNKSYGYAVQRRKSGFYGVRNTRGYVPPDGHWRFIVKCAELAQSKVYVADIELHWMELSDALYTARHFVANAHVRKNGVEAVKLNYNAADILNLKTRFEL